MTDRDPVDSDPTSGEPSGSDPRESDESDGGPSDAGPADDDLPDDGPADSDLPDGWTVWNDEPGGRAIFAYRPDVFDTEAYPPACLPTLYVAAGAPNRPAAEAEYGTTDVWRVEFFLEPDVELVPARTYDAREAALAGAHELAAEFARGGLDYRGAYQVPREEYLDRLDELTGRRE